MNVFYISIRATENYEFDKIRTAGVTENATNYRNSQGDNSICSTRQGVVSGEGSGSRAPHLKSVPPLFHVWPSGCCIHPILYFKNVAPFCFFAPPSVFWSPLLLNLGDGPATRDEISQPSRPISPRAATAANSHTKKQQSSHDLYL